MASANIVTLNQANFKTEVLGCASPVLVDFWAEWCGPCKMIAPVLEELATEYNGQVRIGKVNIDEDQGLASQYGIRAIPTLLLFKGGQVAEQIVGLRSKRDLKSSLDRVLTAPKA
jgi:thioredoxin 1